MTFRLGLVGLCTSHPGAWVPIIRALTEEGLVDVTVVAAWDSGETRPPGYAREFCEQFDIPTPLENLEDMLELVDGVIVHTTNWDRHIEQARPFIEAEKAVLIDKPLVGNLRDANQLLDWAQMGKRSEPITSDELSRCTVSGYSSTRYRTSLAPGKLQGKPLPKPSFRWNRGLAGKGNICHSTAGTPSA